MDTPLLREDLVGVVNVEQDVVRHHTQLLHVRGANGRRVELLPRTRDAVEFVRGQGREKISGLLGESVGKQDAVG